MSGLIQNDRSFDVILFDLGDTLIYFNGNWEDMMIKSSHQLAQNLKNQGFNLNETEFLSDFSKRMQWYYQEREQTHIEYTSARILAASLEKFGFKDIPDSIIQSALNDMYQVSQTHWYLEEDTLETLTWLTEQSYRLGLITNASDTNDVYTLIEQHQLEKYFEKIIISAEFGLRKPHPAIFEQATNHFEVPPNRCLMVGDKLANDILGAQKAGIPSVWIKSRGRTEFNKQHIHIQPDYEIETLRELKDILK